MKTLTKVQSQKIIKDAIDKHLNKGVSLDDTARNLDSLGVDVLQIMQLGSLIQSIGKAEGWILTPEKIKEKVVSLVKDNPVNHFVDILNVAKLLDLPQLNNAEKQKAIADFAGVESSKIKASSKFTQLRENENTIHGQIVIWVNEHPDFTASELYASKAIPDSTPKQKLYYDEFLAWREFYKPVGAVKA